MFCQPELPQDIRAGVSGSHISFTRFWDKIRM